MSPHAWKSVARTSLVRKSLALWLVVSLLGVALLVSPPARAEDAFAELDTAAKLVPEDAAFFSASLRLREQYEIVTGSKAWDQLTGLPLVQMGVAMLKLQAANPQSPPGQLLQFFREEENEQLRDVLIEMVSDEVFIYGDESFVGTMDLMQRIASAMRFGPLMAQVSGQTEYSEDQLQGMILLGVLSDNVELIEVPSLVLGFRVESADAARAELARLETLVKEALEQCPAELEFGRQTVAGEEYLTLRARAEDLPWDEFPAEEVKEVETEPGQLEKVLDRVKDLEVVAALGVRENYVLLSIGPSPRILERLGSAEPLTGREQLAPLAKFADRRVTSLSYLSGAMAEQLNDPTRQLGDAADALKQILPSTDLSQQQQDQVMADARELLDDIASQLPEPGPVAGISFLTDRGAEQYTYNWTDWTQLDSSQPLTLLRHIGGDPMLAVVARGKNDPEQYELLTKWIAKGIEYFEQLGLPEMDEDDRDKAARALKIVVPMLGRIDKINREKLLPALADGQTALVIDRELQSTQFHSEMPETHEPMPMIEPALVFGVSDAELLRQGIDKYADVILDTLRELDEADLIELPEGFALPEPLITQADGATIYSYPLPAEVELDKQIVPNAALGENVAVVSASLDHTKRLLRETPPSCGGVLEDVARPRAMAQVFHIEGMITAANPWILWGVGQATEGQNEGQARMIATQVTDFLDVLTVFKTVTAETYHEGDAWVNHILLEVEDLEP